MYDKRENSIPNLDDTIFITGYAKLPNSITAEKMYDVIAIGVEISPTTGIIVDSDCTLATHVGREFFRKLTLGYCLLDGIESLIASFEKRYYGSARKAIITALKIMYDKWKVFKEEENE